MNKVEKSISLRSLAGIIKGVLSESLDRTYWITAEISEMRENANGICYLELYEKDLDGDTVSARAKATIWAYNYRLLKSYFESSTGQILRAGIKVMIQVSVDYHELYGLSLNVRDIDPVYTIGEMAARRNRIIAQLEQDGVLDMNKELDLTELPRRIAIISSESAAGYGDFMSQINHNPARVPFFTKLFPAIMQGEKCALSIIDALNEIFENLDAFDAVVIIRGGGATADLTCFDDYDLAFHITQFPLPIISGIGHERDDTIVDLVAHTRVKTPTAAAAFLIGIVQIEVDRFLFLKDQTVSIVKDLMKIEKERLRMLASEFPSAVRDVTHKHKLKLSALSGYISNTIMRTNRLEHERLVRASALLRSLVNNQIQNKKQQQLQLQQKLRLSVDNQMDKNRKQLAMFQSANNHLNPLNILQRGYSVTRCNGKVIKNSAQVKTGDKLETLLYEGFLNSKVLQIGDSKC